MTTATTAGTAAIRPSVITAVDVNERKNLNLRSGDTVRVWQKIKEGDGKTRLQAFEGLVLSCKHGREAGGTFTVRKVMDGVGVERIYPFFSPMIDKVEVVRRSKVRRAKLYFVRAKAAKEIRHQMRRMLALDADQNTDTKHNRAAAAASARVAEAKVEEKVAA